MKTLLSRLRNRYIGYRAALGLTILLAGVGIMIISSGSCDSDYDKFVFNKDDYIHTPTDLMNELQFTLEYPRSFEPMWAYSNESVLTVTFLRDYYPERPRLEAIEIEVQKPDYTGVGGTRVFWYNVISGNFTGPISSDFQFGDVRLVENSTVAINGISGLYTAYSYRWIEFAGRPMPHEQVIRRVSFNHAGYVWILLSESWAENAEETEAYFRHLLKTFRILD